MTRSEINSSAVMDAPVTRRGHTLYPGTLGHLKWLAARKNPVTAGGKVGMAAIVEICFAYSRDSIALQKITGQAAKKALEKFENGLTNEAFAMLQDHAEAQLKKYFQSRVVPKKAAASKGAKKTKKTSSRARKR